jgi:hypothetical protein
MYDMLEELLAGTDWEVGGMGDTLICPCGHEIELDGKCPDGCVSPMRSMGFI